MDKNRVARELVKLAKELVSAKKRVVVETNMNDVKSIKKSERQKTKLENAGYTLVDERVTPFRSWMTYELKKASTHTAAKKYNVEVNKLPPALIKALKKVGYRKRDIRIEERTSFSMSEGSAGWEGNRGLFVEVNLKTGKIDVEHGSWGGANMFETDTIDHQKADVSMVAGQAVIVGESGGRGTFMHILLHPKDYEVIVRADNAEPLTDDEQKALDIIGGIKSSYRAEYFTRQKLGPYSVENAVIQSLLKKGLVKANRAGAIQLTTKGKNSRSGSPSMW